MSRKVNAKVFEFKNNAIDRLENVQSVRKNAGMAGTKVLSEDEYISLANRTQIVEPPFNLWALSQLNENNSELGPCIDTMANNIDGYGYRFVPRMEMEVIKDDELRQKINEEKTFLTNFFNYAAGYDSFTSLRKKIRCDVEQTGNAWMEVIRDIKGNIQGFNHIPAYQMRLCAYESDPVLVDQTILWENSDGSTSIKTIKVYKRFRKYVQVSSIDGCEDYTQPRWFKSFGDPRDYDYNTGELVDSGFPFAQTSNEVIHFALYASRSPYGIPRFIGNLISILGDRLSEEINYQSFKNNNIPSMMLLVSNGQLTDASIDRIKTFTESNIQGSKNYTKFLLLEAEGAYEGEDNGQVKFEAKTLTKEQHTDELFQNYSKNNQEKIRCAFRLPPILLGRSSDYSRSTADTSRRIADEQVFAPERDEFDSLINRVIFPEMGIVYHAFRSNTPNTTDNSELGKILYNSERTGGLTPRIARTVLTSILGTDLPPFPEGFPVDVPFSLTMAEAVKNKADPTEVGQQVTALKTDMTGLDQVSSIEMADRLIAIQQRVENAWLDSVKQIEKRGCACETDKI